MVRKKIEKLSDEQWLEPSVSVEPKFSLDSSLYEGEFSQSHLVEDNLESIFDEPTIPPNNPPVKDNSRKLIETLISLYFNDEWVKVFHHYLNTNMKHVDIARDLDINEHSIQSIIELGTKWLSQWITEIENGATVHTVKVSQKMRKYKLTDSLRIVASKHTVDIQTQPMKTKEKQ